MVELNIGLGDQITTTAREVGIVYEKGLDRDGNLEFNILCKNGDDICLGLEDVKRVKKINNPEEYFKYRFSCIREFGYEILHQKYNLPHLYDYVEGRCTVAPILTNDPIHWFDSHGYISDITVEASIPWGKTCLGIYTIFIYFYTNYPEFITMGEEVECVMPIDYMVTFSGVDLEELLVVDLERVRGNALLIYNRKETRTFKNDWERIQTMLKKGRK